MATYKLSDKWKNSVSWNANGELVVDGDVLGPSTGWTKANANDSYNADHYVRYSNQHPDRRSWLRPSDLKNLVQDTYPEWGIRPGWWYDSAEAKQGRYNKMIANYENHGHTIDEEYLHQVTPDNDDYAGFREWSVQLPTGTDPNWLTDFYRDNNIGGPGGTLDDEAKEYWTDQAIQNGSIEEIKRIIRETAINDGTWNQGSTAQFEIEGAGAAAGYSKYDRDSKKFTARLYKTNHKTDNKTDYDTNPDTVQKDERYYGKTGCKFGAFGKCYVHKYGWKTRRVTDWDKINQHEIMNKNNKEENKTNTDLNNKNRKQNKAINNLKTTVTSVKGSDYVDRRQLLRNFENSDNKNHIESIFKDYYSHQHVEPYTWDSALGKKPAYGEFDGSWYGNNTTYGQAAKAKWNAAKANDNIDITGRYGNENTYLLKNYTSVADNTTRGNAAEEYKQASQYSESITDADKQAVKDKQLGVNLETQTQRYMNIPYVAQEFYNANRGDAHWAKLAKDKFLDPSDPDQFVALFRLSERDADKDVAFKYAINNPDSSIGITQLEDAINQSVGEKGKLDAERFGALTQNVLKDTIAEMKVAKGREEFLSTVSGFSGFSEIMDINDSLSNSILGDTGVGGYLSMFSGGKAQESLEKGLQKITGIGNNVTYNWQKWFDEKLVEKYGTDYTKFLPLEEKQDIINAFQNQQLTTKPYDADTQKFSQEFLDLAGYKTTEKLTEFLDGQGDEGSNILNIIKGDLSGASQLDSILTRVTNEVKALDAEKDRSLNLTYYTGEDDPDTPDVDERISKTIRMEASFGRDFIDNYLTERFDTSKSMDEFTEYLSVRQEEQNPFQTQDMLNAVKQVADLNAQSFLDTIQANSKKYFDSDFYMDPTGVGGENVSRQAEYEAQKNRITNDWNNAKNNPDNQIDPNLPTLGTWKSQLYRFGVDPNNKEEFAKMHFQIIGQGQGYDPAEDHINPTKVKNHIYNNILPLLSDEALEQGTIFGKFVTPEEFADDMLQGLDPKNKNTWDEVLQRFGLEDFKGSVEELKEYIMETLRTGSAQQIRENIKYLNEKRQEPTQQKLGVSYIQREEDYKQEQPKGDTELYSVFQKSGYQGTEDEFYNDFFPDLNRSEQKLLTKGGKDDPLKTWGLDMSDPFASLGTISSFMDEEEDTDIFEKEKTTKKEKSFFTFDDDDDWEYTTGKKGKEVLDEFTTLFKGL